jgi:hypothetical protein
MATKGKLKPDYGPWRLATLAVVLLMWPMPMSTLGQQTKAAAKAEWGEEFGYLGSRHDHAAWPTPEVLARDLHSSDDETRRKAFHLMGLDDTDVRREVWSNTTPSVVVGSKLVVPDQIRLTYAALGESDTQEAVIAIQNGAMTYAAVGVPTPKGWLRAAAFSCWCKYEMNAGQDTLREFVQLRPAPLMGAPTTPARFELVLRASGGGTGIYTQDEAHFRLGNAELRRVLAFASRFRTGSSSGVSPYCEHLEHRFFYTVPVENKPGGILVEAKTNFNTEDNQDVTIESLLRDLADRHFRTATCRPYVWDKKAFRYRPAGAATACRAAP